MKSYTTTIVFTATPEEVFNHINDVPKWWVRHVAGSNTIFEGESTKLGDTFILRHGDVHYSNHQLITVIPNTKIVWVVTDSSLAWIKENKQEWTGTKMIFEISADGESTILQFTHEGLVPLLKCYEHCVHFWERIIKDWLFNYIISGKTT